MGYRVTSVDEIKKENKNISSKKFKSVRDGVIMFSNLNLLANAPKYEDIVQTQKHTMSSIENETADELDKKKNKKKRCY